MIAAADLKPLQRAALLAALSTPAHTLVRGRGVYAPPGAPAGAFAFTVRTVRALERDDLLRPADAFADTVELTPNGLRLALELVAAARDAADRMRAA